MSKNICKIFLLCLFISLKLYSQPQNINGLRLWLSADSNVVINNNNVSQWIDISGNGYVFSQIAQKCRHILILLIV